MEQSISENKQKSASNVFGNNQQILLKTATIFITVSIVLSIYTGWFLSFDSIRQLSLNQDALITILFTPFSFILLLSPLFTSPLWFFSLCLFNIGLIIFTILRTKPSYILSAMLTVGAVLILISPFILPTIYGTYKLYAEPTAGYEMRWITQPNGRFESAFKNAQRIYERRGTVHRLNGWQEDNVLYFQTSGLGSTKWRYNPKIDDKPQKVQSLPDEIIHDIAVNKGVGNSYPAVPQGFPHDSYNDFIVYETAVSPNKQWVAVAIKNYYGPSDIVILQHTQS